MSDKKLNLCKCGCGNLCRKQYLGNHFFENTNPMLGRKKELHHSWKGGIRITAGRAKVLNQKNKYVNRSRIVMAEYLGRELDHEEFVHHINENPIDDRIENLELMRNCDHMRYHNSGEKHRNFGKHIPPESKKKMSDAAKKRLSDPEERRKISERLKGKHPSPETRAKMSVARRLRITTPETKAKMSLTRKKLWAAKKALNGKM